MVDFIRRIHCRYHLYSNSIKRREYYTPIINPFFIIDENNLESCYCSSIFIILERRDLSKKSILRLESNSLCWRFCSKDSIEIRFRAIFPVILERNPEMHFISLPRLSSRSIAAKRGIFPFSQTYRPLISHLFLPEKLT